MFRIAAAFTTISAGSIYRRNRGHLRLDNEITGWRRIFRSISTDECHSLMERRLSHRRDSGNFLDLFSLQCFVAPQEDGWYNRDQTEDHRSKKDSAIG